MINIKNAIIITTLFFETQEIPKNKFASTINYSTYNIEKPKFKNTMDYNTTTTEEMVHDTNVKLLQNIIIDSIEQCDSNSMVE